MGSGGRAMVVLAIALGALACEPQYPGEAVGSFAVTGRLEDNGCGAAVPALDPVSFSVELREDRGEAFWRRPDFPVVSGTARDGTYRFRSQTRLVVIAGDPDPDFGHAGCTVTQSEVLEVVLERATESDAGEPGPDAGEPGPDAGEPSPDAGADAPAMQLEGTHAIDIVPDVGSDCRPATVAFGGPFLALPCGVDYTLAGTETAPF